MTTTRSGRFDGRIAVVTGAASGIGRACAEKLVAEGARVFGADLGDLTLDADPARWAAVRCDVTAEDEVAALIREAAGAGTLDVLVNCAGVTGKVPIDEMTPEIWRRLFDTNVTGTAFAIKHAVRAMKAQGRGSIVNISSTAAHMTGSAHNAIYAASKGAVDALTRALVYELAPLGIRVNAVAPGVVSTPILDARPAAWLAERSRRVPAGRLGVAGEIADVVAYLASDSASYVNGQTITADGGLTAVHYSDRRD